MTFKTSNLEELIGALRIQIGDIDTTPTYSDEHLHQVLGYAVNALMPRWSKKYYLDNDGVVQRNTGNAVFDFSSPPVIQRQDERAIILQASIMIKSGKKFSESGNAVTWKDEEISYSNREAALQRASSLSDDVAELNSILPAKKLARALYGRLYGWSKDYD